MAERARQLPRETLNTRKFAEPGRHNIACIEQDCPGAFEIRCQCGESTWTPWGAAHAEEIARMHLWKAGVPLPKGLRG